MLSPAVVVVGLVLSPVAVSLGGTGWLTWCGFSLGGIVIGALSGICWLGLGLLVACLPQAC